MTTPGRGYHDAMDLDSPFRVRPVRRQLNFATLTASSSLSNQQQQQQKMEQQKEQNPYPPFSLAAPQAPPRIPDLPSHSPLSKNHCISSPSAACKYFSPSRPVGSPIRYNEDIVMDYFSPCKQSLDFNATAGHVYNNDNDDSLHDMYGNDDCENFHDGGQNSAPTDHVSDDCAHANTSVISATDFNPSDSACARQANKIPATLSNFSTELLALNAPLLYSSGVKAPHSRSSSFNTFGVSNIAGNFSSYSSSPSLGSDTALAAFAFSAAQQRHSSRDTSCEHNVSVQPCSVKSENNSFVHAPSQRHNELSSVSAQYAGKGIDCGDSGSLPIQSGTHDLKNSDSSFSSFTPPPRSLQLNSQSVLLNNLSENTPSRPLVRNSVSTPETKNPDNDSEAVKSLQALPSTPELPKSRRLRPNSTLRRTPGIVIDMRSMEPVDLARLATPFRKSVKQKELLHCRPSPFYKPEKYKPSPERFLIVENPAEESPPKHSPLPIGLQTPRRAAVNPKLKPTPMSWRPSTARRIVFSQNNQAASGLKEAVSISRASSPLVGRTSSFSEVDPLWPTLGNNNNVQGSPLMPSPSMGSLNSSPCASGRRLSNKCATNNPTVGASSGPVTVDSPGLRRRLWDFQGSSSSSVSLSSALGGTVSTIDRQSQEDDDRHLGSSEFLQQGNPSVGTQGSFSGTLSIAATSQHSPSLPSVPSSSGTLLLPSQHHNTAAPLANSLPQFQAASFATFKCNSTPAALKRDWSGGNSEDRGEGGGGGAGLEQEQDKIEKEKAEKEGGYLPQSESGGGACLSASLTWPNLQRSSSPSAAGNFNPAHENISKPCNPQKQHSAPLSFFGTSCAGSLSESFTCQSENYSNESEFQFANGAFSASSLGSIAGFGVVSIDGSHNSFAEGSKEGADIAAAGGAAGSSSNSGVAAAAGMINSTNSDMSLKQPSLAAPSTPCKKVTQAVKCGSGPANRPRRAAAVAAAAAVGSLGGSAPRTPDGRSVASAARIIYKAENCDTRRTFPGATGIRVMSAPSALATSCGYDLRNTPQRKSRALQQQQQQQQLQQLQQNTKPNQQLLLQALRPQAACQNLSECGGPVKPLGIADVQSENSQQQLQDQPLHPNQSRHQHHQTRHHHHVHGSTPDRQYPHHHPRNTRAAPKHAAATK